MKIKGTGPRTRSWTMARSQVLVKHMGPKEGNPYRLSQESYNCHITPFARIGESTWENQPDANNYT